MKDESSQSQTILVVDDEESVRTFVAMVLSQADYTLLLASSGEDALQQSRDYKGQIHLLLSNVQMPGITGVELGAKLQLERQELRVMLMSGYTSGLLVLSEGWHFLHKPFVPSQLLDLVKNIVTAPFPPEKMPDLDEHAGRGGIRLNGAERK